MIAEELQMKTFTLIKCFDYITYFTVLIMGKPLPLPMTTRLVVFTLDFSFLIRVSGVSWRKSCHIISWLLVSCFVVAVGVRFSVDVFTQKQTGPWASLNAVTS